MHYLFRKVFLLPACIPHSPQRFPDTIGLVIERERLTSEKDCLRYYVENSSEILYEKWFYCESLEELGPLIKEYFASEQYKTGRPVPGTILDDKPIKQDLNRTLEAPFSLQDFMRRNNEFLDKEGKMKLFKDEYVSRVHVLGKGAHTPDADVPETFLWQIAGNSKITMEEENKSVSNSSVYQLRENQVALVPVGEKYELENEEGGRTLSVIMNPVKNS